MTGTFYKAALLLILLLAMANPQLPVLDGILGDGGVQANVVLAAPSSAPFQSVDNDGNNHMWGDWDGWGWIFMIPMMLIFWGGLIWLIVWVVRGVGRDTSTRYDDPLEIARRRYARGEISSEELDRIVQDLRR